MIILEDLDFSFTDTEVERAKTLWRAGAPFKDICKGFRNREADEVFLLLLHLSRQSQISKRKGFIWGQS